MSDNYKQDSTKGTSMIIPLNYKGDVITQVWMDSRVLATMLNWLDQIGVYPRAMSEVVREPLKLLMEHLVDKGEVILVDDTNEARNMLQKRFKVNLNKGGRGGKNVLHNQVLSTERDELAARVEGMKRPDVNVPNRKKRFDVKPEDMQKMLEIMNELEKSDNERKID